MTIQLDTATLIAIITESLFFGIHTVLFLISLFILVKRGEISHRSNKPLTTVSILLYILGLVHLCITSQRVMVAFLQERDEQGGPSAYLGITANSLYLAKIGIYTIQTMVGDSFMAYRMYIVWGRNKRLLGGSLILLVASLVCGVVAATDAGLVGPDTLIFIPRLKHWILSFFLLTLVTNLIFATLIAYKIWSIESQLNKVISERRGNSPVLPIIIESSAVYSASLICLTALFAAGSWAQYIVLDTLVQIIGIVFSLIIVRVGLGLSHGSTPSVTTHIGQFASPSRSTAFSFDRGGQQVPMAPLVIRIHESRETDGMPGKTSARVSQDE